MLKNVIIAILTLIVAYLLFQLSQEKEVLIQKNGIDKEIILEQNSDSYMNRIVKFNEDKTLELGDAVYNYHKVNGKSKLYSKREGKWLVFDSTNNLVAINWYQRDKLYYHKFYLGDDLNSTLDTFYSDSFNINLLSKPKVWFKTDTEDSSKLIIDIESEYPLFLLTYHCNSNMKLGKASSFTNSRKVLISKKDDGSPIKFNVGFQNWEINYERRDSFSLEY